MTAFDPDDFELRWPPELFAAEAARLLQGYQADLFGTSSWASDVGWLLSEAFTSTVPIEEFNRVVNTRLGGRSQTTPYTWLAELAKEAVDWPSPGRRKPYWSSRQAGTRPTQPLAFGQVVKGFIRLIDEFSSNGYLANAFGQDCVDDESPSLDPAGVLTERLGYAVFWPLRNTPSHEWTPEDLYDLIEVFHDLIARPTTRWYHQYAGCGWHYSAFATRPGRRLYRWRVNRLLGSSGLGLRLADDGEDIGRLVRAEPSGLENLSERAVASSPEESIDRLGHAIALFRARGSSTEQRRSAVIALAGILEERRSLIKTELMSKDEDALFRIANEFSLRHRNDKQRSDYDDAFLDWFFWWYLATVELTNQMLRNQE